MVNLLSRSLAVVGDFLVETRARLGTVDTLPERLLLGGWRELKRLLRSRRRSTAASLVFLIVAGGSLQAQSPAGGIVSDPTALAQRVALEGQRTVRQKLTDLWNESRDNAKWVTDIVQTYRTIKMAKAMYESVATFDLASNVAVVDILPEVSLTPGYYFGSSKDGFSSTTNADGERKDSYLALRFRTRNGGAAANLANWSQFKPNMSIDPHKLISDLANLDFDAVKMVQRYNASGNPVGDAIQSGKPEEAAGKLMAYFDDLLKKANNWPEHRRQERAMVAELQQRLAVDAQAFEERIRDLRTACDEEDQKSKQLMRGLGISVSHRTTTFETMYGAQVEQLRRVLAFRTEAAKKKVEAAWQDLADRKTNNEAVQGAITNSAEVTKLMAENEQIQSKAQKAFEKILDANKAARADKGERAGNKVMGLMSVKSEDLKNMKLPPQAEAEVQRLLQGVSIQMQMQDMKLQALSKRTENLKVMDTVGADLYEAQKALVESSKVGSALSAWQSEHEAKYALKQYDDYCTTLASRRREEEQVRNREILQNLEEGNRLYFKHFSEKGVTSAAKVFDRLASSFGLVVRSYFGGKRLSDVLRGRGGSIGKVQLEEEWALYDRIGSGGQS